MPLRTLVLRIKYDALAVAIADGRKTTFIILNFIFQNFLLNVANRRFYQPYMICVRAIKTFTFKMVLSLRNS